MDGKANAKLVYNRREQFSLPSRVEQKLFLRDELARVNASNTGYLFGLFADDELSYRLL